MPLVIITGLPCSGKTHRAQQIASEFAARISADSSSPSTSRVRVIHLPSYHSSSDNAIFSESQPASRSSPRPTNIRDQSYNSAAAEKTARAEEFSAIKRALAKDVVVIADGLNYIKGYRYQLWCEAKAAGTRCCVVHVAAREDECVEWNNERLGAAGRGAEVEEPDLKTERGDEKGAAGLVPESHTAIYGDRAVTERPHSRSSSLDGQSEGDGRPQPDDVQTLKSLYLNDRSPLDAKQQHDTTGIQRAILPERPLAGEPDSPPTTPPAPSSSHPYSPSTLRSLFMRYEPPSPFSRWDTPLFTLPTSDLHAPYTSIWTALFPPPNKPTSKKALSQMQNHAPQPDETTAPAVKQHAATILPASTSPSTLQLLESTTQLIITSVLAVYRSAPPDTPTLTFHIKGSTADEEEEEEEEHQLTLSPNLHLSQPLLQRLRRKYTAIQRGGIAHGMGHVQGGRRGVAEGFVRFLQAELGE